MQCYEYLAAVTAVSNAIDSIPIALGQWEMTGQVDLMPGSGP